MANLTPKISLLIPLAQLTLAAFHQRLAGPELFPADKQQ
jgi:hypothetical protein